ncbi:Predicted DNA-binding transcriptional regulator YafY, contains an HTH and WYL domains [Methylomagnum ishizawai]|uniref:Predicted DNA-binding transcriptional regulator YafY, contains an HTH and WYL domains n=1 Tax=Methylomagnum ishizawai TaxID=1760988 RepID=A0A1Y6D1V5_9GAMM|nr:WYL domain-containing protein [Methylomagnum ishizawai]SMF94374.1 Predicted DNA-binding transcriptional regulator YafY, contains an HTH and WYL domains [Methylomagnum ishizawai]
MPQKDYGTSLLKVLDLMEAIPRAEPGKGKTIKNLLLDMGWDDVSNSDARWGQRIFEMLEERFGELLVVDKSRKPHRYAWRKDASLNIPAMSRNEAITLLLVEQYLKPLLHGETLAALSGAFEQARKHLAKLRMHLHKRSWLDKVRAVPAQQPLLPPVICPEVRERVYEALHEERELAVLYQKPWQDEPVEYRVHPLGLIQKGLVLYLACMLDDYEDVRVLSLHRIKRAWFPQLSSGARRPPGFDLDQALADGLMGMGGSREKIRLVARFYKPSAQHLLDTPLSADQVAEDFDTYHLQITATVLRTAQLEWWLLSFGSNVEVMEPPDLREFMAKETYWMGKKYKGD